MALVVLLLLSLEVRCGKKNSAAAGVDQSPIAKPLNPADFTSPEVASRGAKIVTSVLRMFVSSYNTLTSQLLPALLFFNKVFKTIGSGANTQIQIPTPGVTDAACARSGTFHSEVTNTGADSKRVVIAFHSCDDNFGSAQSRADGTVDFALSDPGFTGTSPDDPGWFPSRISGAFQNVVLELTQTDSDLRMQADLQMRGEGSFIDSAAVSASMNSTMDGVMILQGSSVVQGTRLAIDYGIDFQTMNFTFNGLLANLAISGGWRLQDNIEPSNSFEAIFENVGLGVDMNGNTWSESVSAGSTIYSRCLGGRATMETTQTIQVTFPQCPTTGTLDLYGNGRASIAMTGSGGVAIDVGGDGSVDRSYALCESPQFTACGSGGTP